jgi:Domain of unknown function (DUF5615)
MGDLMDAANGRIPNTRRGLEYLRQRGYDAVYVLELDLTGKTDAEYLEYTNSRRRAVLTREITDFPILDHRQRETAMNTSVFYFPIK